AELTDSSGARDAAVGRSVAIPGCPAVVGVQGKNSFTGAAYVFVRSGANWSQKAKLTASDGASNDDFGHRVAISDSAAMVGAFGHNLSTGTAYVFMSSAS